MGRTVFDPLIDNSAFLLIQLRSSIPNPDLHASSCLFRRYLYFLMDAFIEPVNKGIFHYRLEKIKGHHHFQNFRFQTPDSLQFLSVSQFLKLKICSYILMHAR